MAFVKRRSQARLIIILIAAFCCGLATSQLPLCSEYLNKIKNKLTSKTFVSSSEKTITTDLAKQPLVVKELESLQTFNHIHVGKKLPDHDYLCISIEDLKARRDPPKGRFRVYLLGEVESTCCHDLECTPAAQAILDQGGHLQVCSDVKLAHYFGIAHVNTGYGWKLTESLMLIEDAKGKIRAIFRNASLKHLPEAIEFIRRAKGM